MPMDACNAYPLPPDPAKFPHAWTLYFATTPIAPKLCRDFVGNALRLLDLGHLADTAVLCTSELVTNACVHAEGPIHLLVTAEPHRVRICVYDNNPTLPTPAWPAPTEENGRGLHLVRRLSDEYGVTPDQIGALAKGVWFKLDTTRAAA